MILDDIVASTVQRVAQAKALHPDVPERAQALLVSQDFPFYHALRGRDVQCICEVKKASPSKGVISEDFPYLDIAKQYEAAGAACISVLTEPNFFQGSPQYLQDIVQAVHIPVLRKDFIIDEYQVYEAKLWGASAILLIVRILTDDELQTLHDLATRLGLSVLVEAHTEEEIHRALAVGARIIGVNNRNLADFTVDVQNGLRLRHLVPDDVVFVSESGITTSQDMDALRQHHVHAALIGEHFMRSSHILETMNALYGDARPKMKVCGITHIDVVPALVAVQPDYVGFVLAPSKRQVRVEEARQLGQALRKVAPQIQQVGVFVNASLEEVVHAVNTIGLDVVQLHGDETNAYIEALRQQMKAYIWQAIPVCNQQAVEVAKASIADLVLFDAYSTSEKGGTGQTFNWQAITGYTGDFALAGGLHLDNVMRAIRYTKPAIVDMSSSLEIHGVKDSNLVKRAVVLVTGRTI